jgi:hypothetical protein
VQARALDYHPLSHYPTHIYDYRTTYNLHHIHFLEVGREMLEAVLVSVEPFWGLAGLTG